MGKLTINGHLISFSCPFPAAPGLTSRPAIKLALLTSGAQSAVSGESMARGVLGAAVWGFGRSVRLEACCEKWESAAESSRQPRKRENGR